MLTKDEIIAKLLAFRLVEVKTYVWFNGYNVGIGKAHPDPLADEIDVLITDEDRTGRISAKCAEVIASQFLCA